MILIYTDGSCARNPGKGGWAALLVIDEHDIQEISGKVDNTTNNRMEQTAVIKALEHLPSGAEATIYTDSEYVVETMKGRYSRRANKDLWTRLDELVNGRRIHWEWVAGHSGHPQNEFVNALAGWESGVLDTRPNLDKFLNLKDVSNSSSDSTVEHNERGLPHLDAQGRAFMVDVGEKRETEREAIASGTVFMAPGTLALIQTGELKKGDVFGTARIAGIMAAKETSRLIPLCHPIPLTQVSIELEVDEVGSAIEITATTKTMARTGVEMEALTAVAVAALTIYDMAKALDRGIRIDGVRLIRKRGGRSGEINLT